MNNPNEKLVLKDIDEETRLKKSLGMFSTGITIVTTVDDNKIPIGSMWSTYHNNFINIRECAFYFPSRKILKDLSY